MYTTVLKFGDYWTARGSGEQRPAFRLPHGGLWLARVSPEAPWPTALFSSFPNEVGKVNNRRGRRRRGLLGRSETGLWLSAGRGTVAVFDQANERLIERLCGAARLLDIRGATTLR
ncbi:hypothetical protein EYF80_026494 [Liparis tanakae]|uniref:Uncharacterized protein n=1 Tax=Liparis tanakae TaxID=230148 RepID=A0A4Z2HE06_9TELE|nr:hypothetical protein EYF80_026494 [Liparis tanakae]